MGFMPPRSVSGLFKGPYEGKELNEAACGFHAASFAFLDHYSPPKLFPPPLLPLPWSPRVDSTPPTSLDEGRGHGSACGRCDVAVDESGRVPDVMWQPKRAGATAGRDVAVEESGGQPLDVTWQSTRVVANAGHDVAVDEGGGSGGECGT